MEIDRPLRPLAYLGANELSVIGPWLKAKAERMQHQNPFRLCIRSTARRRRQNDCHGERNNDG
jgi:hypothetical protein